MLRYFLDLSVCSFYWLYILLVSTSTSIRLDFPIFNPLTRLNCSFFSVHRILKKAILEPHFSVPTYQVFRCGYLPTFIATVLQHSVLVAMKFSCFKIISVDIESNLLRFQCFFSIQCQIIRHKVNCLTESFNFLWLRNRSK